ncbi:HD domain-containing protein [Sorangium sp. So ce295]|uniref:HD domain-containing protein n=1 Tax=Sorangium sp. So ce295 TaxID=3133295 RepID=UPI003F607752
MTTEIAGIHAPDTRLAHDATVLAREVSAPYLFHHVMRSYYFGELAARQRGIALDRELLYLSVVLHDLGLTERFAGPERFEVDGANAARAFLVDRGLPREKASLVWDAIALHTSLGIAPHKEPEVAVAHLGIAIDYGGLGLEALPRGAVEQILRAYPRLEMKQELRRALCGVVERKPHTTAGNFLADYGRRYVPGFQPFDASALLEGAPFDS